MPRILKQGDQVREYRIDSQISKGRFAVSYKAINAKDGMPVFFKLYISPACSVSWYKRYIQYQKELSARIKNDSALNKKVVCALDMFEEKIGVTPVYFQVFEFVDGGTNLEKVLEKIRIQTNSFTFEQRLIFAKVLMSTIADLHKNKIIHCDLKPANTVLFEDRSIKAQYRMKLIDTDFSILDDKKAPWVGSEGYVGTPGYLSPEHLCGKIPMTASDVFTCGLILYELLGQDGHPYASADPDAYKKKVLGYSIKPPKLAVVGTSTGLNYDAIAAMIHRCLNPKLTERPSASEIWDSFFHAGHGGSEKVGASPSSAALTDSDTDAGSSIILKSESRKKLRISISTKIGKNNCRQLGSDYQFYSDHQFTLDNTTGKKWIITPNTAATNETLLNGKRIETATQLKTGDVIGIGSEKKKIIKLPLTVTMRG